MSAQIIQFPKQPVQEVLLTKRQLSREIGRSKRWIEYAMSDGMPYLKRPNGHTRFRLSEVLDWLDEGRSA